MSVFSNQFFNRQREPIGWNNPYLLIFFLAFYYLMITPLTTLSGDGELYGELADAFLAGQTHLLKEPDAKLLLHPEPHVYARTTGALIDLDDHILYDGKFYVFYGPAPVFLLFAPYKWLTGETMHVRFAAWLLTLLGTVTLVALYKDCVRRLEFDDKGHAVFIVAALVFGTFVPYQLHFAFQYQVAIGGAYLFTGLGFLLLLRAFDTGPPSLRYFALASLCFGLAAGCRMNFALAVFVLLIVGLYVWRSLGWKWNAALWKNAGALGLPFGAVMLLLLYYNYIRFGNPWSLGVEYQIFFNINPPLTFKNVLLNLYLYFFHPIPIMSQAPIFRPDIRLMTIPWEFDSGMRWGTGGRYTQEPVYGMFANAPFLFMLLFAPKFLWHTLKTHNAAGMLLTLLGAFAIALMLSSALLFMVTMRYMVDFVPWLMLLAALSYLFALRCYDDRPYVKLALRTAGITTIVFTVLCGFVISFIGPLGWEGYY